MHDHKPWYDAPLCKCGGPLVTYAPNDSFRPGMRLQCCACGQQVAGTDEQHTQAAAADDAWHRECEQEDVQMILGLARPGALEDNATLSLFDEDGVK